MQQQHSEQLTNDPTKISIHVVTIGKIEENAQVTATDTGWSEEEKERMKTYGYDSLDIVRAWYS